MQYFPCKIIVPLVKYQIRFSGRAMHLKDGPSHAPVDNAVTRKSFKTGLRRTILKKTLSSIKFYRRTLLAVTNTVFMYKILIQATHRVTICTCLRTCTGIL